jgi:hypothetical protein
VLVCKAFISFPQHGSPLQHTMTITLETILSALILSIFVRPKESLSFTSCPTRPTTAEGTISQPNRLTAKAREVRTMTGRFTAMSGFLTGLFSQSPTRVSSERSSQDHTRASPTAGPSTFGSSPDHKSGLAILEDKPQMDDSLMYGVELDISTLDAGTSLILSGERSIASSGFYGTSRINSRTDDRKRRDKGKGKARDEPPVKAFRRVMEDSFQPVRVYRCPASDRPLYTLDRVKYTITIHATDADSRYWPSKAHQKSSEASEADHLLSSPSKKKDWHEPVNSETKQCLAWKQKCGHGLARLLDLEGGECG